MNKTFFIFLLLLIPIPAYADHDSGDISEDLGWIAVGVGILGTLPFIFINKMRRYAVSTGNSSLYAFKHLGSTYKIVLNFHIMMNSIGYFAGMMHGLLLSKYMDSVSISLAIVMTVLMTSGLLLRYTSSRHLKLFNRLLHGQFVLVILLIGLIILHLMTADD